MISEKDILYKTVIFLTGADVRMMSVRNGELLISEQDGGVITKIAFVKILAIFMAGRFTITTPVLDALSKNAIPFCLMKMSLRPILWNCATAEGNYLLRQKQFEHKKEDIGVARVLIGCKITNQIRLLERLPAPGRTIEKMKALLANIKVSEQYEELMSFEAFAAKLFFKHWFDRLGWKGRAPRMKTDPINVALDVGYSVLFNYIEANLRFFGFDLYVGVYHRLFFQRKSLVCDIMEPFRCIIDNEVSLRFGDRTFKKKHFRLEDGRWFLDNEYAGTYWKCFAEAVIERKTEIFRFVRDYYRAFMKGAASGQYPCFLF